VQTIVVSSWQEFMDLLRKIVLPPVVREDGMRSLYRMNITNASLFPDLGGLARSIALELEIVWPAVGKVAG
jgi:hypothetical protein